MDRILVVCDFHSECSKAIETAIGLAGKNSKIFLLNIISEEYCREAGRKKCRAKIKEMKEEVRGRAGRIREEGLKCRTMIRIGEPMREVPRESKRLRCTFIVVEYKNNGIFRDYTIEEISDNIMNASSLPVMVVS
ncbi:MAG: hypothetical protein DRN33_01235 [Thermoplasmata archaeon]|nr:MAG: hypothetical protein DRN33_01235 [Thermoplasmata archaeon]